MLRFSKKKIITFWAILTFMYVLYVEEFLYAINMKRWHTIQCKDERECVRILLVADPQIIGNMNEHIHIITPFSILDCDRYLKKTYGFAYEFVKPDVVLFLGDLMDEGHVADDEDFYKYVKRIFDIFLTPFNMDTTVKHIWLPGDNDIGGEDTRITPKKLQRFERAFPQPSLHKDRQFYDTSNIFIGVSHVPLMFLPSPFVTKVIDKMQPHLLFTAHEHKSMIINTDALLRQDYHITPITPDNIQVYEYSLGITDLYEIMIPTSSYRMGTKSIGYGFAVIENSDLKFTVLWSPERLFYLEIYVFLFGLPILLVCLSTGCGCVLKRSRHSHIFVII
ncbi:hypothetical protein GWI33_001577 [Rhynchophorus ferrugineus]|uniref:Calcineurin-like phosphoesterase domain-containing protein n=1 Tax=Rhynchophorus ferrugineus TaxID=354439 RepID=A0A834MK10_RHYFE|nr:hypothetical protein GWI33_001577 [Rhynchophorus ferrugineus]